MPAIVTGFKLRLWFSLFLALAVSIFLMACSTKSLSMPLSSESKVSAPIVKSMSQDASQAEWEKVVINAKKEGIVVLYGATGVSQAREPFIRAIREKFGISLDVTIAGGAQLTTKLVNERRAGVYIADVYLGGADSILSDLIPRNILAPIEPYLILPEVKDPSAWFGGNLPFWEKQRLSLASRATISSRIAINNSLLQSQEYTSYKDLLKPKIKGLIVLADPTVAGSGLAWSNLATKLMGEDYLRELVTQDVVLTRDMRLMNEWIARGKYPLGIGVNSGGIRALIKDGAPLQMLPPFKEGIDLAPGAGNIAAIEKNPHPNAAMVFVNWFLSKEGQAVFSKADGIASRRLDAPKDHLEPWQVPDPKMRYIIQDEEYTREENRTKDLAKEIFAPLLK